MKPPRFEYAAPRTVEAALGLLARHGTAAQVLAGGQSLIPALRYRLATPALLVDLGRIDGLACSRPDPRDDGALVFGAMTRHVAFERSPVVRERLPLLAHAIGHVGHVQVRNRGTIGGSLCHADPAAEWPALCLACDAVLTLVGPSGERNLRAREFVRGPFTTALAPGELLTAIAFPRWPQHRRWGFRELARRRGDFALAGVACTLDLNAAGGCRKARIAVFGAGEAPALCEAAAGVLEGPSLGERTLREAARAARAAIRPHGDIHASAEYRAELVETLVLRALGDALREPSAGTRG